MTRDSTPNVTYNLLSYGLYERYVCSPNTLKTGFKSLGLFGNFSYADNKSQGEHKDTYRQY